MATLLAILAILQGFWSRLSLANVALALEAFAFGALALFATGWWQRFPTLMAWLLAAALVAALVDNVTRRIGGAT